MPLIMIGLYIPRIPTQGRYKTGSPRIDRVSALLLDRVAKEHSRKRSCWDYQAAARHGPTLSSIGTAPSR